MESKIKVDIQMLKKLPTLSFSAEKIINLMAKESSHLEEFVDIIEKDPPIMSKVLGIGNIVYFGFYQPVTSIKDAILKIGFKLLKDIVLSVALFSLFKPMGEREKSYERLYRHSIATGAISQIISEKFLKDSTDNKFIAGILHDIGLFVLHYIYYDLFKQIEKEISEGASVLQAEKKIIGATHPEIGRWFAEIWGLPDFICEVIFYHHNIPEKTPYPEDVAVVQLSNFIAERLGYMPFEVESQSELHEGIFKILPVQDMDYLISELKEAISKVEQL
uniref:HDOD domain-containing protein n=1 Tax=Thermodesulfovibrio aggregans TaxID=86166 RepID=A0A7C4EK51_9BACT